MNRRRRNSLRASPPPVNGSHLARPPLVETDLLLEDVSIDGMCVIY
jgi:mycofactocin precursor